MEEFQANITVRVALVALPVMAVACYHEFERVFFNFYQLPFDFFSPKVIDFIVFVKFAWID